MARIIARAHRLASYVPRREQDRELRTLLYRCLFALRHPDAIGIWRRGVDYDQYRRLNRPWLKRLQIRTVDRHRCERGTVRAPHPRRATRGDHILLRAPSGLPSGALGGPLRLRPVPRDQLRPRRHRWRSRDFWKSPHTPSSSFLPMTSVHEAAYPESRRSSQVRVRVRPLDEIGRELDFQENLFVKIDVQGYEGPVLRGGQATLRKAAVVLIETSFVPLYRAQLLVRRRARPDGRPRLQFLRQHRAVR